MIFLIYLLLPQLFKASMPSKICDFIIKESEQETLFYKILRWAERAYPVVCGLNSNNCTDTFIRKNGKEGLDFVIAAGAKKELFNTYLGNFERLKDFFEKNKSGLFGFFSYDLKDETEPLLKKRKSKPAHQALTGMPLLHFFIPRHVFILKNNTLEVLSWDADFSIDFLTQRLQNKNQRDSHRENHFWEAPALYSRVSKKQYIDTVNKIKQHIHRGDIYELNYCQEFYADNATISPLDVYQKLNTISPMPFSCFYKLGGKYLLCASPERFLRKKGNKIISQPIKGTARRGKNKQEDEQLKKNLLKSDKERSENVMIVDLVRNDLSRIAAKGTVKVEELFSITAFKNLFQMISTVSCRLDGTYHFTEAIKCAFPMGSMTGAPKVKAMELIDRYETTKRGLFSGAAGYITSKGDFDFNVVIRGIQYNREKKLISIMAGSAITAECDPEKEYEESLLKAQPVFEALGGKLPIFRK